MEDKSVTKLVKQIKKDLGDKVNEEKVEQYINHKLREMKKKL